MRANDTKIISVTDLPAYEDEFDIKHYINGLANFIKSCETPLTIAIQGEWGSGKTSIMNMVREQLDHTKNFKYKSIWFNTWQYAQCALSTFLAKILNIFGKIFWENGSLK